VSPSAPRRGGGCGAMLREVDFGGVLGGEDREEKGAWV